MDIKRLTPSQKKTIVISVVVAFVFCVTWLFIYLPTSNTVKAIKSELAGIESQVHQIESGVVKSAKTLEEGLSLLEARYNKIESRFPSEEEESLKMLSGFARAFNMEIISIKPSPRKVLLDKDGKEVTVEGKICQVISVSVTMNCVYPQLVSYVEKIEKELPDFITIERMNIMRSSGGRARELEVVLDLNLYLLVKKNG